jgi:peptidoglycan/LPS O-acetylase OafA/YrhL
MIANIQVLRAFASAVVVFHHLQAMVNTAAHTQLDTRFGLSGVDVFFVISGFIMFQTTRSFRRTTVEFWSDRIIRIVPLYWLATFVLLAFYFVGRHPNGLSLVDGGDIATSLLFIPDVRADGITEPVLSLGWTLNYEMFFYLIFGLTFFMRSQLNSFLAITGSFMMLIAAGLFFAPLPHVLGSYTNPITLEFSAGCLLSLLYNRWTFTSRRLATSLGYVLIFTGVATIVFSSFYIEAVYADRFLRFFLIGSSAVLVVAGALVLERAGHTWNSRLLLLLGSASYAGYLFHPLVMQPIAIVVGLMAHSGPFAGFFAAPPGAYVLATMIVVTAFIAAIFAGIGIHLWVEKPMQRWLGRAGKQLPA